MGRVMLVLVVCATVLPVITSSHNQSSKVGGPPGRPGNNGHNGHNGIPGAPGRDGRDGLRGKPGTQGAKGDGGKPGRQGAKGDRGRPGLQGTKGDRGKPGLQGAKGDRGKPGPQGAKGDQGRPGIQGAKGDRGRPGPQGAKGDRGRPGLQGATGVRGIINWKQCAWNKGDGKDNGLIKECIFKKKYSSTSLRVLYGGNLRIVSCTACCKRWYFTFNGAECNGPLPIDGIFYISINNDIHRHRNIQGYCNNIPAGKVRVGFWVGNCKGYGNADAHSGWNSVSRIVIEEVPPQQS